jgi:hypothetical protein
MSPDDPLLSACWGAQLRGDASMCTPGFTGGTAHFKNKFCPACKTGTFGIPVTHIRALPRSWNTDQASMDLKLSLSNGHSVGFWKILPDGEGRFRFVNNTLDCEGPQLVVFRELPSPMLTWGVLPERWVDNGKVTLQVAKGTLVPRVPMSTGLEPELWRGGGGRVSLSTSVFMDGRGHSSTRAHTPTLAPRPSARHAARRPPAHGARASPPPPRACASPFPAPRSRPPPDLFPPHIFRIGGERGRRPPIAARGDPFLCPSPAHAQAANSPTLPPLSPPSASFSHPPSSPAACVQSAPARKR